MCASSSVDTEVIEPKNKSDWVVSVSKKLNKIYYFNSKTGESLWDKPSEFILTSRDLEKVASILSGRKPEANAKSSPPVGEPSHVQNVIDAGLYSKKNKPNKNNASSACSTQESRNTLNTNMKNMSDNRPQIDICNSSLDDIIKFRKKRNKDNARIQNASDITVNTKMPRIKQYAEKTKKLLDSFRLSFGTPKIPQENQLAKLHNNKPEISMEVEGNIQSVSKKKNKRKRKKKLGAAMSVIDGAQLWPKELAVVLDTNVLIKSLKTIQRVKDLPFKDFPVKFIVPYVVLDELDHLKASEKVHISFKVKRAIKLVSEELQDTYSRFLGQKAKMNMRFRKNVTSTQSDDLIIDCCLQYKKEGHNVVLFTYDKNLVSRALMNDIECTSLENVAKRFNISLKYLTPQQSLGSTRTSFGRTDDKIEGSTRSFGRTDDKTNWQQQRFVRRLPRNTVNKGISTRNIDTHDEDNYLHQDIENENESWPMEVDDVDVNETQWNWSEKQDRVTEQEDYVEAEDDYVEAEEDCVEEEEDYVEAEENLVTEEDDRVIEEEDYVEAEEDRVMEEEDRVMEEEDHVTEEEDRVMEEEDRVIEEDCSDSHSVQRDLDPLNLKYIKVLKKTPENAHVLVTKLRRAITVFLKSVFRTSNQQIGDNINLEFDENSTQFLEILLRNLQLKWEEVTKKPLLEGDMICVRLLKKILLQFVDDVRWTVAVVEELINATRKLSECFQKCKVHQFTTMSFILSIRDCEEVAHRLKQEILQDDTSFLIGCEKDVLLAQAAFDICWNWMFRACNELAHSLSLKKSNGELNTSKSVEEIMKSITVHYKWANALIEGLNGVLDEDVKKLTLDHKAIVLLYSTVTDIVPDDQQLKINYPEPPVLNRSSEVPVSGPARVIDDLNQESEDNGLYCMIDLTPKCILALCCQQNKRGSLRNARNKMYDFASKITQSVDSYLGLTDHQVS